MQTQTIDVWGELVRTRDAVPNMLWAAITDDTMNELAPNFSEPMPVHSDQKASLGMKDSTPTGCSILRVEVQHDDGGPFLAGLLRAPAALVERPMHWSFQQDGPAGAKLLSVYFVDEVPPSDVSPGLTSLSHIGIRISCSNPS
jgi:hypothetical protein